MIYYDITDLVDRSERSHKVTGIQRVVLEGLRRIADKAAPCFFSCVTGKWYIIEGLPIEEMKDLKLLRRLREIGDLQPGSPVEHFREYSRLYIERMGGSRKAIRSLKMLPFPHLTRIIRRRMRAMLWGDAFDVDSKIIIKSMPSLKKGDVVALFDSTWNGLNDYDNLLRSAPDGVHKVFLIYDLIPLYCDFIPDGLRDLFKDFFPFVLTHATSFVVNSDHTAKDLARFAKDNDFALAPIAKVQLAHHMPDLDPDLEPNPATLRIRKLFNERFALSVGSIESRKNHINLLNTWHKFVHSPQYSGEKLVIAGSWLWDFEACQHLLGATGHIGGSVVVIDHPDDDELRALYERCHITVYPSHYEGWGLPIGESLSFGKPCLHFDNSSLREAGFGMSDFVPYHNLGAFYDALVRLMQDDAYHARRCEVIQENYSKLRTWTDFGNEIANLLESLQAGPAPAKRVKANNWSRNPKKS